MVNTAVETLNEGILKMAADFWCVLRRFEVMTIRSLDAAPFVVERGWWRERSGYATRQAFRRGGVGA